MKSCSTLACCWSRTVRRVCARRGQSEPKADPQGRPCRAPPAESARRRERRAPPDVSALSSELSTVLDELIQARTRASCWPRACSARHRHQRAAPRRDHSCSRTLTLDGVPVHDSMVVRSARLCAPFQGYVAPGVHEIGIEIAEQSQQNAPTSTPRERFRIGPEGHHTQSTCCCAMTPTWPKSCPLATMQVPGVDSRARDAGQVVD